MKIRFAKISFILFAVIFSANFAKAQNFRRELALTTGAEIEIVNNFGRVDVLAEKPAEREEPETGSVVPVPVQSFLTAEAEKRVDDGEIKISNANNRVTIEVVPADAKRRIDLTLRIPERTNLKIRTGEGEVRVSGDFAKVEVRTETGTIAADVPLENLKYNFLWTASRPRFISDVELDEVSEKAAGKFAVSGRVTKETPKSKFSAARRDERAEPAEPSGDATGGGESTAGKKDKKDKKDKKEESMF